MRSSFQGSLMILAAAASWGTWSIFLRPTGLAPTVTAPLLLLGVFLFSLPLVRFDGVTPRWDRATWLMLGAYALLDAINVGTFFAAMSVTSVAVAVLTHSVAPVLVALAAPAIDKRPSPRALPAAVLAVGGLVLLLRPWEPQALTGAVALGAGLGLASALAYASLVFVVGRLAPRLGPARTMGYHALGSALLLAPLALAHLREVELSDVGLLALAALLPGVLAGVAFVRGLEVVGAAKAAVLAFLEPVVACGVGWAVFGEALPPIAWLGAALVLSSGVLVSWPPRSADALAATG